MAAIVVAAAVGIVALYSLQHTLSITTRLQAAPADPNYTVVSVVDTGTVSAAPTLAQIVLSVQTESQNITQALLENDNTTSSVVSALAQLGVGSSNLSTVYFDVYPMYNNNVFEGYQVTNTFEVNMSARNTILVGRVVEAVVMAGATQVDSVSFTLSPAQEARLESEALSLALSNASQVAQHIASQLGLTIVGVKDVSAQNTVCPPPIYYPVPLAALSVSQAQSPQFYPGQTQYTVSVQVDYLLS